MSGGYYLYMGVGGHTMLVGACWGLLVMGLAEPLAFSGYAALCGQI